MQKYIFIICIFLFSLQGYAQRKQGSWQDYLSFTKAIGVAAGNDKIFCITEGGLFYYDIQDNSVNKFTGMGGLSDFGIRKIAYEKTRNILVIAYENSNIDLLLDNGSVINLSDIKRKQITGDKSIYNITFIDGEAFLSCGFGIVVLNLNKHEVKDTYFIGENGGTTKINDVEAAGDFIYAATDNGILKVQRNSNLLDYQNWAEVDNIPNPNLKFNHLVLHGGKLIANYTPDEYDGDKMYVLNGDSWDQYLPQIRFAHDIQVNENYMTVASRAEVFIVDNNHSLIGMINYYEPGNEKINKIKPRSSVVSANNSIWIADYENALVRVNGENFELASPGGPMDNFMFSMHQAGNDLWVAPGGTSGWELPRFQRLRDGNWKYFRRNEHPEFEDIFNIVAIAVDPFDQNHFFAASWSGGLLEYQDDEFVSHYNNKNSPLQSALPQQPDAPYVRVRGLAFDAEGNLWITNSEAAKNLLKLTPDNNWESFTLPAVANNRTIGDLIVTQNNDKWILVPRGHDAYVVNSDGSQKKQLLVTSYFNNGENEIFNRMNEVFSIAEDKEGSIWIGTSKGVAVYNSPSRIWEDGAFYATQPSLDLNDGIYHPLLETETVTAIAVDGANRKWLGTKNSGVYLISESGENEILHFTEENSPLLSNNITSIAINQNNGEVFFGTEEGLISYLGEAIDGLDTYANVYVYPNPVRETYEGPVTITGLIENTDVKITDISGNLVYKTQSLGGQAIWDGNNLNGNRVKTGVYLVLCNNETGEETHITKLLFIN